MPASYMSFFPHVSNSLEGMKIAAQTGADASLMVKQSLSSGIDLINDTFDLSHHVLELFSPFIIPGKENQEIFIRQSSIFQNGTNRFLDLSKSYLSKNLDRFYTDRLGEIEFFNFFTEELPSQDWSFAYDDTNILLDLPGMRVIDISLDIKHKVKNYAVVFAPRAGHHSNIAERVALYMRDAGLSRMAVVENKCAEDIPLYINGKRHRENFDGQVSQYKKVLEHLQQITGHPSHLIAVCQPGPLLISTLILNPHLGKTFGSAGAPMHTEGESGLLTNFARAMGEDYIDLLIKLFGYTPPADRAGAGRKCFDGRIQVLGFYLMGMEQHFRNLTKLLSDLKEGNEKEAQRQMSFYRWYNYVIHFSEGFLQDTFKKIFVKNELIRGTLCIHGEKISIENYPGSVPIWSIGGTKDDITPPLQATGHMNLIKSVPRENKLTLICDKGHMGLFRAVSVLKNYYKKVVEFILAHSDYDI